MSHTLSTRRRPASPHTPEDNVVHFLDLGKRAREAEATRIAELLGPAGLAFLRDLLAVTS